MFEVRAMFKARVLNSVFRNLTNTPKHATSSKLLNSVEANSKANSEANSKARYQQKSSFCLYFPIGELLFSSSSIARYRVSPLQYSSWTAVLCNAGEALLRIDSSLPSASNCIAALYNTGLTDNALCCLHYVVFESLELLKSQPV